MTFILANFKTATLFTFVFALAFSCDPKPAKKLDKGKSIKYYSVESPTIDEIYSYTDAVNITISNIKNSLPPDSVHILSEGKLIASHTSNSFKINCQTLTSKFGRRNLRIKVFFADSMTQILTSRIVILPDELPEQLGYKVLRQIPHNPESYTQGLIYYNGYIYEGTGQLGQSKLMKIDPENGTLILVRDLEDELFGEGIAIYNDQIYQLTYKSMLGFVYDLESFERLREFDLQTAEGWGLTSDSTSLIVSDGSTAIYFYDPVYLSQTEQIEVCDNRGLITNLNELEFIDGNIWANVYGKKYILRIDAQSGKVTGKLDLTAIFPKNIPDNYEHVLNGIAYDKDNDNFYITGKMWPVLYEIKITD